MVQVANKWQSKVDALILLAEDQAGKPEGDLAKEKLRRILRRFPELRQHKPLDDFASRVFTMQHLSQMRQQGVSTNGSWTGGSLNEAIGMMVADYKRRLWERKTPGLNVDRMKLELVVSKSLRQFAIDFEQVVCTLDSGFLGTISTYKLRPFRRMSGSAFRRPGSIDLQAWAVLVSSDGAERELGPGIKVRAMSLPRNRTRVNMKCCYPAFYSAFNKLAFDLSDADVKIAYLKQELEALEPLALEKNNA